MACHNKRGYMIFSSSPYVLPHFQVSSIVWLWNKWICLAIYCKIIISLLVLIQIIRKSTTLPHILLHATICNMLFVICREIFFKVLLYPKKTLTGPTYSGWDCNLKIDGQFFFWFLGPIGPFGGILMNFQNSPLTPYENGPTVVSIPNCHSKQSYIFSLCWEGP